MKTKSEIEQEFRENRKEEIIVNKEKQKELLSQIINKKSFASSDEYVTARIAQMDNMVESIYNTLMGNEPLTKDDVFGMVNEMRGLVKASNLFKHDINVGIRAEKLLLELNKD